MSTKLVAAIALSMAMTACSLMSPDAKSVVSSAQKAMGSPKSIQYSGTGMNAFFGQALSAGKEWPRRDMTSYTRTINYDQKAASDDMTFAQPVFGGYAAGPGSTGRHRRIRHCHCRDLSHEPL